MSLRFAVTILSLTIANSVLGQDPTVPSVEILQKLNSGNAVSPNASPAAPIPAFQLRAIVMFDSNRGAALVESSGRRYRIQLDRTRLPGELNGSKTDKPLIRIQANGTTYVVEDFSASSLSLFDGARRILVQ